MDTQTFHINFTFKFKFKYISLFSIKFYYDFHTLLNPTFFIGQLSLPPNPPTPREKDARAEEVKNGGGQITLMNIGRGRMTDCWVLLCQIHANKMASNGMSPEKLEESEGIYWRKEQLFVLEMERAKRNRLLAGSGGMEGSVLGVVRRASIQFRLIVFPRKNFLLINKSPRILLSNP
jgi:hypothetical protein